MGFVPISSTMSKALYDFSPHHYPYTVDYQLGVWFLRDVYSSFATLLLATPEARFMITWYKPAA